jgi:hypothetical protein
MVPGPPDHVEMDQLNYSAGGGDGAADATEEAQNAEESDPLRGQRGLRSQLADESSMGSLQYC